MKKIYSLIGGLILLALNSCNFLDVVPEGQANVDDMFNTQEQCQKFVYYLYADIPTHGYYQWLPDMFAGDDLMTGKKGVTRYFPYKSILYGEENANNTYYGLWSTAISSPTGRTNYDIYNSIRYCYMLLERVGNVPGITQENYNHWRGEAYFLIAYYHQELLSFYGPIVLVKKNTSLNASEKEMYPARSTYDECVDFIAENYDKAAELLPAMWPEQQQGRASAAAAKAYKARLYLTAASPLYNGNSTDFSKFVNKDGTTLMNLVYDANKWKKALDAAQDAIEYAEANDYYLYTNPSTSTALSNFDQGVKNYHDAFCETIWNRHEVFFSGNSQTGPSAIQRYSAPRISLPYTTDGWRNYICPTFEAVEMYYTKNGLPLDVDPLTKDQDLYSVASGDSTALLHRNREPRFYANVGYDRGPYEVDDKTVFLHMRGGELHGSTMNEANEYQSCTGYLNKKFVNKHSFYDKTTKKYFISRAVFPYIRLAELYLSYAEADFEYNGFLSAQSLAYINKVRNRSGLPNFEDSWAIVGGIPTGNALRKVLHQERSIEFLSEGRRYFDIRRWKEAEEIMNKKPKAWNLNSKTQSGFYTISTMPESGTRVFVQPMTNWLAIPLEQMNINYNLVQNPGY